MKNVFVILSAGNSSRMSAFLQNSSKSLHFLTDTSRSSLSLLLNNLIENNFLDIILVVGENEPLFTIFVQKYFPENNTIKIINAFPQCEQGPLFSFLAAKNYIEKESNIWVFPADTLFKPELFLHLSQNFREMDNRSLVHLFYCEYDSYPSFGNRFISLKREENCEYVAKISTLEPINTSIIPKLTHYKLLLPFLLVQSSFINTIFKSDYKNYTTLIQFIESELLKKNQVIGHQIPDQISNFYDLDTPEDLKNIALKPFIK